MVIEFSEFRDRRGTGNKKKGGLLSLNGGTALKVVRVGSPRAGIIQSAGRPLIRLAGRAVSRGREGGGLGLGGEGTEWLTDVAIDRWRSVSGLSFQRAAGWRTRPHT